LGSKAKFETEYGTQELETYVHHIWVFELASVNGLNWWN
jgi:hypothetical protein